MLDRTNWIETSAKILSCRYQFARMNTLTMGIQTREKFRISFEYYAHGRLYPGEFQSAIAIAPDESINIRYNPLHPEQNTYTDGSGSNSGRGLIAVGVAGSIVLSLLWAGLIRGCA